MPTRLIKWLFTSNSYDRKHLTYTHSLLSLVIFYWIHYTWLNFIDEKVTPNPIQDVSESLFIFKVFKCFPYWARYYVSGFLLAYWFIIFCCRVMVINTQAVYEFMWACNILMFIGAYGLWADKPFLVNLSIVNIAMDQILWWIDITGYLLTGKFYVKVSSYLAFPQITFVRKITTFHHLWFLPLLLACMKVYYYQYSKAQLQLKIHAISFFFAYSMMFFTWCFSPKEILIEDHGFKEPYWNINFAHEPDKQIKFDKLPIICRLYGIEFHKTVHWLLIGSIWTIGNCLFFETLVFVLQTIFGITI